jgi:hypothetical protein
MSQEVVIDVIMKAMTEVEFRSKLFKDPDEALAEYDLTEEEKKGLSSLKEDAFDEFVTVLEERISKTANLKFAPPYVPVHPGPDDMVNIAQMFRMEINPDDLTNLLGGF